MTGTTSNTTNDFTYDEKTTWYCTGGYVNGYMNERIQQLAERAGIEWDEKYHYFVSAATMRLFAQSVAQECADIALREEHDPYECIKKHFGLTE